MNSVHLMGRLTRDPEIKVSQTANGQMTVARYTLAIDRRYKKEGEQSADFISCVAFGKSGEFAEKYLRKGTKIAITGRIQTGSYTNKRTWSQKIMNSARAKQPPRTQKPLRPSRVEILQQQPRRTIS